MEIINSSLLFFDEANIICPQHEIPSIGVCGEYICSERRLFCMKCLESTTNCFNNIDKHELITLSELFFRFFIRQENKALDLAEYNLMMEQIKSLDRMEIFKILSDYCKSANYSLEKHMVSFEKTIDTNMMNAIAKVQTHINNTKINYTDSIADFPDIIDLSIPDSILKDSGNTFNNPNTCIDDKIKNILNNTNSTNLNDTKNIIKLLKFFNDMDRVKKNVEIIDNINLISKYNIENLAKYEQDMEDQLSKLEEYVDNQLNTIENVLIPNKDSSFVNKRPFL